MGSWTGFLFTYLLGGITFIPLLIVIVLLHAHLTFPVRDEPQPTERRDAADDIVQPGDDTDALQAARKEDPKPRFSDGSDQAAGYFAVCREYTPMGINAKPIERPTPVGTATVAAPSPSVYQSMYRSIFDRKQAASPIDDNKSASQRPKKAGNVFYVVLRHGHLMLFDDEEQLEVRHVVSLAHHDVSIYSGGDCTPEGELFIKRNALCLTRRIDEKSPLPPDFQTSKPFYLFSENCSAKEDFYFCLLRNQSQTFGAQNIAPDPQRFDVKNIISLVQKLHASEEHMQTRWLNAFIGRMFLGLYKTKDAEHYIREKITKKISRVNRPSFLTKIAIQKIDMGDAAPYVTNPRLRDLNVEGECVVEADVKYTGSARLEVAAVARIDLGSRLKAREVNLVLAVVLRKLEGHVLFKIKPPPSNRLWFTFQSTPKMEMHVEPIVSSRQITYTVILRQIENRIKEVVAETLVLPFWDDVPFFNTEHKQWRGGIFQGDDVVRHSPDYEECAAQLGRVDEVTRLEAGASASAAASASVSPSQSTPELPVLDKSHTMPVEHTHNMGFWNRLKPQKSPSANGSQGDLISASTTALDTKGSQTSTPDRTPRHIRSGSFTAPIPIVGTDPAHAEPFKPSSPPERDDVVSTIATLSAKSQSRHESRHESPAQTPGGSPPRRPSSVTKAPSTSSNSSSKDTIPEEPGVEDTPRAEAGAAAATEGRRRTVTTSSTESLGAESGSVADSTTTANSPALSGKTLTKTGTWASTNTSASAGTSAGTRGFFASRKDQPPSPAGSTHSTMTWNSSTTANASTNGTAEGTTKRGALTAMSNAAATAKRWGLNAIQRQAEKSSGGGGGGGANGNGNGNGTLLGRRMSASADNHHHHQAHHHVDLNQPMGRGQPLPPPGTPLPGPSTRSTPIQVTRRKSVAPPPAPAAPSARPPSSSHSNSNSNSGPYNHPPQSASASARQSTASLVAGEEPQPQQQPPPLPARRPVPPPPLPLRQRRRVSGGLGEQEHGDHQDQDQDDDVLVVEAPVEETPPPTPQFGTEGDGEGDGDGDADGDDGGVGVDVGKAEKTYVGPWVEDCDQDHDHDDADGDGHSNGNGGSTSSNSRQRNTSLPLPLPPRRQTSRSSLASSTTSASASGAPPSPSPSPSPSPASLRVPGSGSGSKRNEATVSDTSLDGGVGIRSVTPTATTGERDEGKGSRSGSLRNPVDEDGDRRGWLG